MPDSHSSKYVELDVRYKDNNPDTLQFNIGQLQDRYADAWVLYADKLNSYDLSKKDIKYSKLVRQINEAQFK